MTLKVSSVDVHPIDDHERLYCFASVVFEEEFVVHNIRLVKADSGIIVAMPSEEHRGTFRDLAHPIDNDCRKRIKKHVIRQYKKAVATAD
jgi:stage V sporulation protein G